MICPAMFFFCFVSESMLLFSGMRVTNPRHGGAGVAHLKGPFRRITVVHSVCGYSGETCLARMRGTYTVHYFCQ